MTRHDPEYLSVDAATARFGLGRTTLFDMMADGRLRRYKVGQRTLLSVAEVRDLIQAGASVGPAVGPGQRRA
jgi:excisionase family DNA binding protein